MVGRRKFTINIGISDPPEESIETVIVSGELDANVRGQYLAVAPTLTDEEIHNLRLNQQGELIVAPTIGVFESYEVESGTTTSATTALTLTFTQTVYRLNILVETSTVDVEISADGETYGEHMKLPIGTHSFDAVTKAMKLYDNVEGSHGDVQLVGWYSLVGDPPAERYTIISEPVVGEGRILNLVYRLEDDKPVLRAKTEEVM